MFTFVLMRRQGAFTRYGIQARILENGRACRDTPWFEAYRSFYGNDGRTLRADAIRWAKARCAQLNGAR